MNKFYFESVVYGVEGKNVEDVEYPDYMVMEEDEIRAHVINTVETSKYLIKHVPEKASALLNECKEHFGEGETGEILSEHADLIRTCNRVLFGWSHLNIVIDLWRDSTAIHIQTVSPNKGGTYVMSVPILYEGGLSAECVYILAELARHPLSRDKTVWPADTLTLKFHYHHLVPFVRFEGVIPHLAEYWDDEAATAPATFEVIVRELALPYAQELSIYYSEVVNTDV